MPNIYTDLLNWGLSLTNTIQPIWSNPPSPTALSQSAALLNAAATATTIGTAIAGRLISDYALSPGGFSATGFRAAAGLLQGAGAVGVDLEVGATTLGMVDAVNSYLQDPTNANRDAAAAAIAKGVFVAAFAAAATPLVGAAASPFAAGLVGFGLALGIAAGAFDFMFRNFIWPRIVRDPLILDLDGDGIEVSALDGSAVYFDYDSDGVAERTGWVSPDDGMLAYDANGNGIVDGIHELFGSPSQDGFEVLETLDANQDGVLDASDPAFAHLRVWRDLNQNGVSDSGELQTVGEAGITSFNLARTNVAGTVLWRASSRKTAAHFSGTRAGTGHDRGFASTFTRADGSTGAAETIYFQTDRQSTADPTPTFTYLTGINVAHGALGEPMTSSDRTGQWPPSFRFPGRNDCPAFVVRSM